MNASTLTQEEVRVRGMDALKKELGIVGTLRFLQQFDRGKGDYTKERHRILDGLSLNDILRGSRAVRRNGRHRTN